MIDGVILSAERLAVDMISHLKSKSQRAAAAVIMIATRPPLDVNLLKRKLKREMCDNIEQQVFTINPLSIGTIHTTIYTTQLFLMNALMVENWSSGGRSARSRNSLAWLLQCC